MEVTPELLSAFPLLKPLPKAVLSDLAKCSSLKKFSRRGIVLEAGEAERSTCFLFEGRLQGVDFTIDGREVGLYFVEPGDFCGEIALFDAEPQSHMSEQSLGRIFAIRPPSRTAIAKNPSLSENGFGKGVLR